MTIVRADQLGPQHLGHLIRIHLDGWSCDNCGRNFNGNPPYCPTCGVTAGRPAGTRDLYLAGHRRCDCGRTTVYSPGHRQSYTLLPGAQVEVLADVRGRG